MDTKKTKEQTKKIDKKDQSGFLVGAGLLSLANDAEEGRDQRFRRWRSATSRGLFLKKATLFTWAEMINTLRRWEVSQSFAGAISGERKDSDINGDHILLNNYSNIDQLSLPHHVFPSISRLPSG